MNSHLSYQTSHHGQHLKLYTQRLLWLSLVVAPILTHISRSLTFSFSFQFSEYKFLSNPFLFDTNSKPTILPSILDLQAHQQSSQNFLTIILQTPRPQLHSNVYARFKKPPIQTHINKNTQPSSFKHRFFESLWRYDC